MNFENLSPEEAAKAIIGSFWGAGEFACVNRITTAIQHFSNRDKQRREDAENLARSPLAINHLVDLCHGRSIDAGWWKGQDINDPTVVAMKLALIHSEISEALEGHRKGLMDDHLPHLPMAIVELADAVIRICDLAGALSKRICVDGVDLGQAITQKLEYNLHRADHKPEARAAAGGKRI